MTVDEIRAAALALAPAERGILLQHLLASLDPKSSEEEIAWGAELQRRYEEYLRGEVVTLTAEESIRQARRSIEESRRAVRS